jgi:hypothetical protein
MNQAAINLNDQIAAILIGTNLDVADALQAQVYIVASGIESTILGNQVQRCPTCDMWVWNTESQWNSYKGCCTDCAELDG